jgi:Ca-activated chloride channel homolog
MKSIYTKLFSGSLMLVILVALNQSCYREHARTTGWNYNQPGDGGFRSYRGNTFTTTTNNGGMLSYPDVYYPEDDVIMDRRLYPWEPNNNTGELEGVHGREGFATRYEVGDSTVLAGENGLVEGNLNEYVSLYERYNPYVENEWIATDDQTKSTFSIDVDNAAYTNFRRFVTNNQLPPKDAIRVEEWLNYFNYELEAPAENDLHPLKIATEIAACPWSAADDLVMVKLQGRLPVEANLPPSNLVFLVDVSGSMNDENKLPLVQTSMIKLVNKLRPQDRLSIVTYAGYSSVALQPTPGDQKEKMIAAINGLSSGGGTDGAGGITEAYNLAAKHFNPDGNNRVILATDGDWNMGITGNDEIKKMVEEKRSTGIFLSVLGFGMGNLNDEMMEMLADNGNGNYAYIDNEREAERIFNTEFAGAMYVIAKDVKLQVQFDSTVVEEYRLIGYENRVLENWQFEADSIDAGELGMGQNVIAFYQVKKKPGQQGNIGKIDFRYKPLGSDVSVLLSHDMSERTEETSVDFKFASCVVEFALCLRESEFRGSAYMPNAILRGKKNLGDPANRLSYAKRVEFVGLMEIVAPWWKDYVTEEAPKSTVDNRPQLKLYPNPATEFTTVEVPAELNASWSVQVFSLTGALMHVQHFQETTTGRVDLETLVPGTYIVKVYSGGFSYGYLRLVVPA